ncbi:hypothetical protein KL86DES1_20605 [uncultured Desulfovibrio sp.]|uniref:Uncharacterized protein n=1 Tax=uncultured Desulfovibrio sp. TaxID=167968 RepID=A0A212L4I4_9BACT|nr:hypothetical protein KL86DES1_20605 [uncultured Desulfovibrio sp.]VZH33508.1 conserved protein of unknown function [Desulfovibrio sp. 86]
MYSLIWFDGFDVGEFESEQVSGSDSVVVPIVKWRDICKRAKPPCQDTAETGSRSKDSGQT